MAGAKGPARLVKLITERTRPPARIAVYVEHSYAFPSGHTTGATAAYVTLAVLVAAVVARACSRVLVYAAAVLASAAVGASRVVLGVHWPTDVLGGWLLGLGWTLLCLAAVCTWRRWRDVAGTRPS